MMLLYVFIFIIYDYSQSKWKEKKKAFSCILCGFSFIFSIDFHFDLCYNNNIKMRKQARNQLAESEDTMLRETAESYAKSMQKQIGDKQTTYSAIRSHIHQTWIVQMYYKDEDYETERLFQNEEDLINFLIGYAGGCKRSLNNR